MNRNQPAASGPSPYDKPTPIRAADHRSYELVVRPTLPHPLPSFPVEEVWIPFVGSKHMGVEPDPGLKVAGEDLLVLGEPENPHDSTALVVVYQYPGADQHAAVAYIPRAQKHWLTHCHPEVFGHEGFGAAFHNWGLTLRFPLWYVHGYKAFNGGKSPDDRFSLDVPRDTLEGKQARNWWLCGFKAGIAASAA